MERLLDRCDGNDAPLKLASPDGCLVSPVEKEEIELGLIGLVGTPWPPVGSSTVVVLLAADPVWDSAISKDCRLRALLRENASGFLAGGVAVTSFCKLAAGGVDGQQSLSL